MTDSNFPHRVVSKNIESLSSGKVHFSLFQGIWYGGLLTGTILAIFSFSTPSFLFYLISTAFVLLFGHSLGSHRKLIHNSFECPKWLEYLLVYIGIHTGLTGPIGILKQHELRDYAQRLPQCHDYLKHGKPFLHDGWWQLFCSLTLYSPPKIEIEEGIAKNSFYQFLEKTWIYHHLAVFVLLYVIGGWSLFLWGGCARVFTCITGHWLIGYFAHNHGEMHYKVQGAAVQGKNIKFTSLLTMGECWHNNHHAYPGSAKLGLYSGEWDPGWWILCLLRKLGLVWSVKLPEDLPYRDELITLPPPSKPNCCLIELCRLGKG